MIGYRRLLLLLLVSFSLKATQFRDTIVVRSDTIKSIQLPNYFIDSSSLSVTVVGTNKTPSYIFYPSKNIIYFENRLPISKSIEISYQTKYDTLKKEYSLYSRNYYDSTTQDSAYQMVIKEEKKQEKGKRDRDIMFNGEKGVGLHIGSNGEFTMNQNLDIKLYGNIDDSTVVSANISDQSTSLEGDTKEVGALDKVFITIENPEWYATVGDLSFNSDSLGIVKLNKTPKGLGGGLHKKWGDLSVVGSIDGHKKAIEYLDGVSGIQSGIYTLTGNGEAGQIEPIEGSVEIYLKGKKLQEGSDFVVNYSIGQISFTPSVTILDNDVIEIRYNYRVYNYTKLFTGLKYNFLNENSPIKVKSFFSLNRDLYNSSDKTFTPAEIDSIKASGDRVPQILSGKKLNPNDVPIEVTRNYLYTLDTLNSIYKWESSPIEQKDKVDLYIVQFFQSETGDYLPYNDSTKTAFDDYDSLYLDSISGLLSDTTFKGDIYLFVGKGKGTYTAFKDAVLPEQVINGEFSLAFHPNENIKVSTTIAGQNRDQNILSDINDDNNNSAGVKAGIEVSTNKDNFAVTTFKANGIYSSKTFSMDIADRYTINQKWGLPIDSTTFTLMSGTISEELHKIVTISVEGGGSRLDGKSFSQILSSQIALKNLKGFTGDYLYHIIDNRYNTIGTGRRVLLTNGYTNKVIHTNIVLEEEWLSDSLAQKSGFYRGEFVLNFPKIHFNNRVEHKRYAMGDTKHFKAKEGDRYTLWEGSYQFHKDLVRDLTVTSSLLKQEGKERSGTSLLLQVNNSSYYLDNRFILSTNFKINSSNATTKRWQYIYVGKGAGTYTLDPITGDFIEDPYGDYIAKEVTLWGDGKSRTVGNTFFFNWKYSFKHKKGVDGISIGGTLGSQEDIVPHTAGITTAWIPLYTTVTNVRKDSLNYSNSRYYQFIHWQPVTITDFSSKGSITFERRERPNQLSKKITGRLDVSKWWNIFGQDFLITSISEMRNLTPIKDTRFVPKENFKVHPFWIVYTEGALGITGLNVDRGKYYYVKPGVSFSPKNSGSIDLSYKAGYLDYKGEVMYPMADDFAKGWNHRVYLSLNINAKKHLYFNGYLRADKDRTAPWKIMSSIQSTFRF